MQKKLYDDSILSLESQWQDYVLKDTKIHTSSTDSINNIKKGKLSSICIMKWNKSLIDRISRIGDIWIGLYLDQISRETLEINVKIGGIYVSKILISPGEKKLSLENASFIPLVNLQYHEIVLEFSPSQSDNLHIIYGFISDIPRRYLAINHSYYIIPEFFRSIYTKSLPLIIQKGGMCASSKILKKISYAIQLPDMWKSTDTKYYWRQISKNIIQSTNLFKKELIEKTCHPSRINQWCLTIDEMQELKDLNLYKYDECRRYNQKLWLDEVMILTSSTRPYIPFLKVLRHTNNNFIFKFLNSNGRIFHTIRGKNNRYLAFDNNKPYWFEKINNKRKFSEI